jgi:threonylcarbamoyladenosine tRNA methylthiotransferase MtaB
LHLPLQSGSASVLERMRRRIDPQAYAAVLTAARAGIPDLAVTTDILVGFPGETEDDFLESLAYVRRSQFAGGHVFTFSARPGTEAAGMPGQVPIQERKRRSRLMRQVLSDSAVDYRRRFIGRTATVLWEACRHHTPGTPWEISGLTDNGLRVHTSAAEARWNRLDQVRITGLTEDGLRAEICDQTV